LRRACTCLFRRLLGLSRLISVFTGLNRLLQILAGRPMDQKHARSAANFSLPNQASVETHVIRLAHANAENRRLAIDSDSSCANPIFDFTTRANTSTRKDLLKPFARFGTLRASTTGIASMSLLWTIPRSRLTTRLLAIDIAAMLLVRMSLVPCLNQSFIIFRFRRRTTAPTSSLPISSALRCKFPF
jgi:hypothetical protein